MSDLIERSAAIDAVVAEARNVDSHYFESERIIHEADAVEAISMLPSAQLDKRLEKIFDLVEGTIDHFDKDDAMDLLYQIKEVLRDG